MEQARYWVLKKSTDEYLDESWEEKAFAEDAAGMLGGCVWPPRSYACNFCRREFRSAQALGGHMNVHRRDRAKLKQLVSKQNPSLSHPLPNDLHHFRPTNSSSLNLGYKLDHHALNFRNPNLGLQPFSALVPQFPPSIQSTQSGKNLSLSTSANIDLKNRNLGQILEHHEKGITCVSLVSKRDHSVVESDKDAHDRHKRRKIDLPIQLVFPIVHEEDDQTTKVNGLKTSTVEEVDLELRLGDRPKVK